MAVGYAMTAASSETADQPAGPQIKRTLVFEILPATKLEHPIVGSFWSSISDAFDDARDALENAFDKVASGFKEMVIDNAATIG